MYIILGMFLDPMSVMILTLPIVSPIVVGLGFNLIWFGIVLIMFIEMGLITPPVGLNLFVMQKMAKDVPVGTIVKGSLPFLALMVVVVWLLTFFPGIVLFLPNLM
jgi:TRAP-type C4-dicarboxylate transport system permease large subunit